MPTILELKDKGALVGFDPQLDEDELPERAIYLIAGGEKKLAKLLEEMDSQWDIEITPAEQLDDLVYHFVTGGTLDYPRQFHELKHHREGIWELKTPDLRLFGFFAARDSFICTDVVDANVLKDGQFYAGYIEQAWFRRDRLELDEPKYVAGMRPEDVVSNCYCS